MTDFPGFSGYRDQIWFALCRLKPEMAVFLLFELTRWGIGVVTLSPQRDKNKILIMA